MLLTLINTLTLIDAAPILFTACAKLSLINIHSQLIAISHTDERKGLEKLININMDNYEVITKALLLWRIESRGRG